MIFLYVSISLLSITTGIETFKFNGRLFWFQSRFGAMPGLIVQLFNMFMLRIRLKDILSKEFQPSGKGLGPADGIHWSQVQVLGEALWRYLDLWVGLRVDSGPGVRACQSMGMRVRP